jgi:lambda family phage portal protein
VSRSDYVLVDHRGRPIPRERPRRKVVRGPRATYDAAILAEENKEHWASADSLSARSANSPDVRQRLRDRSRYEASNNPYLRAVISSLANDTIGTGPRLQLSFPEYLDPDFERPQRPPPNLAHEVERRWQEWCDQVAFTDKLILADKSETRDGECFLVMRRNDMREGVGLDVQLFEAEVCTTPDIDWSDPLAVDGLRIDAMGNVVEYHFLRRHPGDMNWWTTAWDDYERIPARRVCHLLDPDRIGEYRGIPATTSSLGTTASSRRFRSSVLHAAETHANIVAVIEDQNAPAFEQDIPDTHADAEEDSTFDKTPLNRNSYIEMPSGKTAKAFLPTQPMPSYPETSAEFNTESGRSINNAPRNKSTGSSAEYNYSSAKLDRSDWNRGITVRRDRRRRVVLLPFFWSWLAEATAIPGYLPRGLPPLATWRVRWQWDGFESIDPVKDAQARQIELQSGQTTLDDVCAEKGKDWEEVLEQQAREMRKRQQLGLPVPGAVPSAPPQSNPAEEETVDG